MPHLAEPGPRPRRSGSLDARHPDFAGAPAGPPTARRNVASLNAPPEPPPGFAGRYVDTRPMADEMALPLIRLWCEALEDANPLYHDAEYARTSRHGGI